MNREELYSDPESRRDCTVEIFPELEYCKTGEWKIYITETWSREFRRSDPESAVGIRKLQDPYFKQTSKWKYVCK